MINEEKLREVIVINQDIEGLMNKLVITQENEPSKKNPNRVTNVIKNKFFAEVMDFKVKKVHKADRTELENMKIKDVAKLCMVTVDKVKEVIKN